MSLALFRTMIEHARWANRRIAAHLLAAPSGGELKIFSHVVETERLYFARIDGLDPWPQNFWPSLTVSEASQTAESNYMSYSNLLDDASATFLQSSVSYRNSSGERFENRISHLLTHVFLHGQHHRGQIALLASRRGVDPPVVDVITFVRQHGDEPSSP